MSKNNYDPVGTLSIGNVVTMGTILYKSNFKRYFQVSLRSTGWLIAIGFAAIGLTIITSFLSDITNSSLSSIPVIIAGIVIILYCLAKYATNRADKLWLDLWHI